MANKNWIARMGYRNAFQRGFDKASGMEGMSLKKLIMGKEMAARDEYLTRRYFAAGKKAYASVVAGGFSLDEAFSASEESIDRELDGVYDLGGDMLEKARADTAVDEADDDEADQDEAEGDEAEDDDADDDEADDDDADGDEAEVDLAELDEALVDEADEE